MVLLSDFLDEHQSLVLSQYFNEPECHRVEVSTRVSQSLVEGLDLPDADTCVLGELLEGLGVVEELTKVHHVFIHIIEGTFL